MKELPLNWWEVILNRLAILATIFGAFVIFQQCSTTYMATFARTTDIDVLTRSMQGLIELHKQEIIQQNNRHLQNEIFRLSDILEVLDERHPTSPPAHIKRKYKRLSSRIDYYEKQLK